MDINDALSLLQDMQKRVSSSLLYVSTLDSAVNSFDRISNSEIHILSKLNRFLTDASTEIAAKPELGTFYKLPTFLLICANVNFLFYSKLHHPPLLAYFLFLQLHSSKSCVICDHFR